MSIISFALEIDSALTVNNSGVAQSTETIFIKWHHPPDGWTKLNCDGACKQGSQSAGCGGLIRDSTGKWIKGYARKLGNCDALHAEMWGMLLGMQLAWDEGVKKLVVESDSQTLVAMVQASYDTGTKIPTIVRRIKLLTDSNWQVNFVHTRREGNRSADWLASYSIHLLDMDMQILLHPPGDLRKILFEDSIGTSLPRVTRLD